MNVAPHVCEPGFLVLGLQDTEPTVAAVRLAVTLMTLTVTSSWLAGIRRLGLFFAHWLS